MYAIAFKEAREAREAWGAWATKSLPRLQLEVFEPFVVLESFRTFRLAPPQRLPLENPQTCFFAVRVREPETTFVVRRFVYLNNREATTNNNTFQQPPKKYKAFSSSGALVDAEHNFWPRLIGSG